MEPLCRSPADNEKLYAGILVIISWMAIRKIICLRLADINWRKPAFNCLKKLKVIILPFWACRSCRFSNFLRATENYSVMKKACVIGWPIGHSRSPLIHNYWLKKYGIDAVYEKKPVEAKNVANFIATLATSEFIGCNVTIPHKETVFGAVGEADEIARRLGAVNTVYLRMVQGLWDQYGW